MVNTVKLSCKQKVICNSQIYHFMYCTGKTKMCKKIAHPGGCWIFRIQVENLTGGGGFETPVGAMSTYFGGKIQNLGAKFF